MTTVKNALVVLEVFIAVALMAGILLQTPKATGLGGGYRTRRGLERQIYFTTWVLVVAFLVVSLANIYVNTHAK